MTGKTRKTELKVVFDTNVLYTQVASDLLRAEVAELLSQSIEDPNLTVSWFLPEVVLGERTYQMTGKATELLPGLGKLERVLGHNLGISPEIVRERIESTIERQCKAFKLHVLKVDYQKVDWPTLVKAAIERTPPFESGQKEKGFRDALAIEAFMQEVERSPKSPTVCRLAFVSEDGLVRDALKSRTAQTSNVRVLADLGELQGLINTLASEVSEEYVNELRPKASLLFFNKDDKTGLYYSAKVSDTIREKFKAALTEVPVGASSVRDKMNWIAEPTFVEKKNSNIAWSSRIVIEQELMRVAAPVPPPQASQGLLDVDFWKKWNEDQTSGGNATSPITSAITANALAKALEKYKPVELEVFSSRKLAFQVRWTTRVNSRHQLSSPRIEEIAAEAVSVPS